MLGGWGGGGGLNRERRWGDWLPFLAHYRVPGDSIYLHKPRPVGEYEALAASAGLRRILSLHYRSSTLHQID